MSDALPQGVSGGYRSEGIWPTEDWEVAPAPRGVNLEAFLDAAVDDDGPLATTHAALVVIGGRIVAERYHGALGSFVGDPTPVEQSTPLISWSLAKTMLAVLVGQLVDQGRLDLDVPPRVPEWSVAGDPRGEITLRQMLAMRDGLDFVEEYEIGRDSDVIEMLFGSGKADMAHFAADRDLATPPGSRYNYSSGTTNIIARIVADELGGEAAMRTALTQQLFGPLGMATATPTFDEAGTFVASSYVHATARDFARFGLMLCRGGMAGDHRVVSEAWVDELRVPVSRDPDDGRLYSLQTWVAGDELGTFWANGYEGQRIVACPSLDLVIVRCGSTSAEHGPSLDAWWQGIVAAVAAAS